MGFRRELLLHLRERVAAWSATQRGEEFVAELDEIVNRHAGVGYHVRFLRSVVRVLPTAKSHCDALCNATTLHFSSQCNCVADCALRHTAYPTTMDFHFSYIT